MFKRDFVFFLVFKIDFAVTAKLCPILGVFSFGVYVRLTKVKKSELKGSNI